MYTPYSLSGLIIYCLLSHASQITYDLLINVMSPHRNSLLLSLSIMKLNTFKPLNSPVIRVKRRRFIATLGTLELARR